MAKLGQSPRELGHSQWLAERTGTVRFGVRSDRSPSSGHLNPGKQEPYTAPAVRVCERAESRFSHPDSPYSMFEEHRNAGVGSLLGSDALAADVLAGSLGVICRLRFLACGWRKSIYIVILTPCMNRLIRLPHEWLSELLHLFHSTRRFADSKYCT